MSNKMDIRNTDFNNKRLDTLGIELLTLRDIRAKLSHATHAQPERINFYLLMLVTSGEGTHTVDFVEYSIKKNSFIFVQPGQVQQWFPFTDIDAQLILITPNALSSHNELVTKTQQMQILIEEWPTVAKLEDSIAEECRLHIKQLYRDFANFNGDKIDATLVRYGLMSLLLRITKWHSQHPLLVSGLESTTVQKRTFRLFTKELEIFFMHEHSLQFYASRLGYSESTISRACIACVAKSAKLVIAARITLEAQRLLAHTTKTINEISHTLGFSEPTNFVKFFKKNTQVTPKEFREKILK